MKSSWTVFGAALAFCGVLNFGAQAAVNEYRITISGVGDPTTVFTVPANAVPTSHAGNSFSFGSLEQTTDGLHVSDTYTFRDISAGGGLSDGVVYDDRGAPLFSGALSSPTFRTGVTSEENADSGNIDMISVASIPEFSTWALMLAGFAGLGMAGYHRRGERRILA